MSGRQATGLVAGASIDVPTNVAGIRRVIRGLDPEQVEAMLTAKDARIRQLRAACDQAVDGQQRAIDALRNWQSAHAETCQQRPPARRPPRTIIGQPSVLPSHQNPPHHSSPGGGAQ